MLDGDYRIRKELVTLEEAVDYRNFGWAVLVDPADESLLARWQQIHSPRQPWNQW